MLQGYKFTECFTQMASVLLVLSFDISRKAPRETDRPMQAYKYIMTGQTCYVLWENIWLSELKTDITNLPYSLSL